MGETNTGKKTNIRLGMLLATMMSFMAWPALVSAAGATLKVTPPAGVYEVGSLVDVSFVIDTGGDAINAVNADILFPADKLQVVNPAASTSFISLWLTAPSYSNTAGTITFQGGVPNPGVKTSAGVISTVTFRIKSAGKASIKYAPTSKVLRNDGEGTNILTSSTPAEFTLKVPPPAGPVVTSPTHGDTNAWYNNNQIQFSWEGLDGATGYSFSFDQNPKQIPDESIDTTDTATTVKATSDGVWYFHLRAKGDTWGGVTTFPVKIDTTPPAAFTPKLDKDVLTTEDIGAIRFVTTDGASGLDHYEVKNISPDQTGTTLFVEATSPYTLPKLTAGAYQFIVRAFDRAGNVTEGTTSAQVVSGGVPFYARVPLLRNPAVANGALIGLAIIVMVSVTILVLRRMRIRSTFRHDLHMLERDAQKKSEALERELDELREAQALVQQDLPTPTPVPNTPPQPPPTVPPQV